MTEPRLVPVLEAAEIAKSYCATCALRGASLCLFPGRVHALLGENGAGKSTLVKIIVGALARDDGQIRLNGAPVDFRSVREAVTAGVIPIYQHLSLFPHLTVIENLSAFALGCTTRLMTRSALVPRETANAWLEAVGLRVDLDMPLAELSIGERQLVEIARGLGQRCKLLVLDEPTAALTRDEADRLFAVIRRLCREGTAILFISHKFDEIELLADDITVLRDGRAVIAGRPRNSVTRNELIHAMLGEAVNVASRELPEPGEVVLEAQGLRMHSAAPPVDCRVRAGEVLGLAGLVGSGMLEIASALAGARPAAGRLTVAGEVLPLGNRGRAIALGVGYVPSDRQVEGLFPLLTALQNSSASILAAISRGGVLSKADETERMLPWLRRMNLHPLRPELPAGGFSGGNQQKLILSRSLAVSDLRVLVVLEPTRGVDIAARETIHQAIIEEARRGTAVVLASSDLDEIMALSHRILVIRQGSVEGEMARGADRAALVDALAGRSAA